MKLRFFSLELGAGALPAVYFGPKRSGRGAEKLRSTAGITLTNVNDGTNVGDVAIPFRVLVGDTNGNGSVTASDIGEVKGQSGQAVTAANFRTDVTANGGSITASDIGLVKSASGTQLPSGASNRLTGIGDLIDARSR